MKGSKKKKFDKILWDMVFGKLKKLGTAIEMYYGVRMDIDNYDYRWGDDRIQMLEDKRRMLNHQEFSFANKLWKKYR